MFGNLSGGIYALMIMPERSFGRTVRYRRTKLGLSQAKLAELGLGQSALIVVQEFDANLWLAARNLPHVDVLEAAEVDPVSLTYIGKSLRSLAETLEFNLGRQEIKDRRFERQFFSTSGIRASDLGAFLELLQEAGQKCRAHVRHLRRDRIFEPRRLPAAAEEPRRRLVDEAVGDVAADDVDQPRLQTATSFRSTVLHACTQWAIVPPPRMTAATFTASAISSGLIPDSVHAEA